MLVLIRGAGDIATGIAMRLWRAGVQVVMTDLPQPTAIRRTVCFSQAIVLGETQVEDATARRAEDILRPEGSVRRERSPCWRTRSCGAGRNCGRMRWWMPFWPSGIWAPASPMHRWWWA